MKRKKQKRRQERRNAIIKRTEIKRKIHFLSFYRFFPFRWFFSFSFSFLLLLLLSLLFLFFFLLLLLLFFFFFFFAGFRPCFTAGRMVARPCEEGLCLSHVIVYFGGQQGKEMRKGGKRGVRNQRGARRKLMKRFCRLQKQ